MHIKFVEISNFRKLLSIRVDLAATTTLFVGANNSGKTSAMLALRRFLSPRRCPFEMHDLTLCHWPTVIDIGKRWVEARDKEELVDLVIDPWVSVLPMLDIWLHVESGEMHHVRDLIPTLDWEGGILGVRLRYEPKDLKLLYKDFMGALGDAETMRAAAVAAVAAEHPDADPPPAPPKLTIWPESLVDFLSRRLSTYFTVQAYSLDPTRLLEPSKFQAQPQVLPPTSLPIGSDVFAGLIRVHDIPAQRGFGEEQPSQEDEDAPAAVAGSRLSDQLKNYYAKHLDPTKGPAPKDLGALQAIEAAQDAFDKRLTESFKTAFTEVEGMGYPGVTDPRPRVSTRLKAIDGLNHSAAVTFEVDVIADDGGMTPILRLPEANNGLGYQNLISMIFRLMSFRDAWMRVGKASMATSAAHIEPLHLVLVEEPEAHLHAQVQQVFIKKAYAVLRTHEDLGSNAKLRTQLVVSTHSSHVAHETSFSCLRYFRRLPAGMVAKVPVSTVINMSEVFGANGETERFVTRYLRAQHADLFFADAAILVEGPAERMLIPNFIRVHYDELNQCYVTLLEIGGSHAHKLRPLIEHLGLLTLVITDLDTLTGTGGNSVQPAKGTGQKTNNATLKTWIPAMDDADALIDADDDVKTRHFEGDLLFAVRVAYQMPVEVAPPGAADPDTAVPYTFEDALAFENIAFFAAFEGTGLVRKFREAIKAGGGAAAIGSRMYQALKDGKKAEFALDLLEDPGFDGLVVPRYIAEGLEWLLAQLKKKQAEILPEIKLSEPNAPQPEQAP
ncbi:MULTISPECIES: AAA family ATPase [Stenotrophomonas]|uniref:AAA family ATPase n=1 Tax=Stenotrophomonas TaxID=40323 RepID=UPI000B727493|nr:MULTISPECIES: AAA family ATPase [Stenotrophomonas]SMR76651.1 Predicted ATP-dependent endonuclease of the OLD family, contains P-loop ATPase and TOPRIM domains [Stenotrophomonas sp. yr243]SNS73760.1 Predicted ATP-dependent endonuclease of the OLD family, contains P-loop ATPase and TOPRIM domains [Stenotrophomonas lactitubi]